MNPPMMSNVSQVLNEPDEPENKKALAAYRAAKKPAEELLAKQRKAQDEYFKSR